MGQRLLNFVRGIGSVLLIMPPPIHARDLSGGVLEYSDFEALRNDWRSIGGDFASAIDIAAIEVSKHVQEKQGS